MIASLPGITTPSRMEVVGPSASQPEKYQQPSQGITMLCSREQFMLPPDSSSRSNADEDSASGQGRGQDENSSMTHSSAIETPSYIDLLIIISGYTYTRFWCICLVSPGLLAGFHLCLGGRSQECVMVCPRIENYRYREWWVWHCVCHGRKIPIALHDPAGVPIHHTLRELTKRYLHDKW